MRRPIRLILRLTGASAGAMLALVAGTALASTASPARHGDDGGGGGGVVAPARITVVNQVADTSGVANVTDPDLLNPWGLSIGPAGGALWVANNNSNTTTLYNGGVNGAAATKNALTVAIPGGKPTGTVFSGGSDFVVTGPTGASGPARFIYSSDQGDITAWNPTADRTNTILEAHVNGAVYRGLALVSTTNGDFLLANDFKNGRIDIFDSTFNKIIPAAGQFVDRNLPSGYTPFNVQAIGSSVYVAYARSDNGGAEPSGGNRGVVDVFTNFGMNVTRIATDGNLNGPWGLAIAPSSFGAIAGDLLVGNFKDGFINVFQGTKFVGRLGDANGGAIRIQKLWAMLPGNDVNGGAGALWFSAGPEDGRGGLVGQLVPAA
ncbi:MAG: hypothetical protein QOE03_3741 [Micromonosporaceae bacterium]|nr:hypothetical protein [Micromonosporaceae bacterium]